jgi:hypothetical protein
MLSIVLGLWRHAIIEKLLVRGKIKNDRNSTFEIKKSLLKIKNHVVSP